MHNYFFSKTLIPKTLFSMSVEELTEIGNFVFSREYHTASLSIEQHVKCDVIRLLWSEKIPWINLVFYPKHFMLSHFPYDFDMQKSDGMWNMYPMFNF